MNNNTLMQYFEWYLPSDMSLWNQVATDAIHLDRIGINMVWLPPAYKGTGGKDEVGYGVYDLYDLGEFYQKGTIPTKYGTKDEYIEAIKSLKEQNIHVLADIVLNHRLGADETEEVLALQDSAENRNVTVSTTVVPIRAWTKYNFPGRNNVYSDFKWNWTHFHGIDWDEKTSTTSIYKFYGKHWDKEVDSEFGNFDYLMGADVDLNNVEVVNELKNWGKWYLETTNVDGFRIDAVKHIRSSFFPEWITFLEEETDRKDIFSVGEYWSSNIGNLVNYIEKTEGVMSLFDVPLHYNFYKASKEGEKFDMGSILNGTLLQNLPEKAVTFVDNHDTQLGQALESWIEDWFKPIAYAIILLYKKALPCIFYGDYYGIQSKEIAPKRDMLDILLKARKYYAYGNQTSYFDHTNTIGFTREGDYEHPNSGLAVVASNHLDGYKDMYIGKQHAGKEFYDCMFQVNDVVKIDENGCARFLCKGRSVSVWLRRDKAVN